MAWARRRRSRAGDPSVSDWYIFIDGQARGPGSTDQLIAYLQKNDPAHTQVWREGFEGWTLARDVPELAAALAAAPPPVADPPSSEAPSPASAPTSVPTVAPSIQPAASQSPAQPQPRVKSRARRWAKWGALAGLVYALLSAIGGGAHSTEAPYLIGYFGAGILMGVLIAVVIGAVVDLIKRNSAPEPSAPRSSAGEVTSAPPSGGNFIIRHWRGELKLWVSYWIVVFVGNFAAAIVIGIIVASVRLQGGFYPPGIFAAFIAIWLCALVVSVWQFVGVWRSARRYKQERLAAGRFRFWGYAAQAMCVFGTLGAVATFANQGGPQIKEAYRMAFANDPDIPDYTIRVTRDGAWAEIVGGVKYGLTDEFIKILAEPNRIKVVRLDSLGGRLGEAQRLYALIRDRGLSTYVSSRCMSACTLAFAGGRERYLRKGATLGFHRGSFPGVKDKELDDVQADVFRQAGFDARFIATALATPNTDLWKPSEDELLKARVVTRVATP